MSESVVDTNVLATANSHDATALQCAAACAVALSRLKGSGRLVVDASRAILSEYLRNARMSGQPGAGDAFLKWAWENQANAKFVRAVVITPDPTREYVEFPTVPDLESFDRDDRKFVATAVVAGPDVDIKLGLDTDWWYFRDPLVDAGVGLDFICLSEVEALVARRRLRSS